MIHSLGIANAARVGVIVLRVVAAVVAAGAVLGSYLFLYRHHTDSIGDGPTTNDQLGTYRFGAFLLTSATPVAAAGVLFALSYMVSVRAAQLDIDIVRADEETERPGAEADQTSSAPGRPSPRTEELLAEGEGLPVGRRGRGRH